MSKLAAADWGLSALTETEREAIQQMLTIRAKALAHIEALREQIGKYEALIQSQEDWVKESYGVDSMEALL